MRPRLGERFPRGAPAVLAFSGDEPDADAPAPSPGPGAASDQGLAGLRVLIVEDEALISLELEERLLALGLEVVGTAQDAAEAVRMAEATKPDFLTMDVQLIGQRDGVSAALEIYERFGLRSIFISAYGDAQTVKRAQQARPFGWLTKPVTRRDLTETLPLLLAELREE